MPRASNIVFTNLSRAPFTANRQRMDHTWWHSLIHADAATLLFGALHLALIKSRSNLIHGRAIKAAKWPDVPLTGPN